MSKITEKALRDDCHSANGGPLKEWDFGLKVEKFGDLGYVVFKLFRKAAKGQERLLPAPLSPKEVRAFIHGFVTAATIVNLRKGT